METIVQKRPEPEQPDPVPPTPPTPSADPEPAPPAGPKNNTLAVVSLVLGIVGILSLCLSGLAYINPYLGGLCACFALLFAIAALVTGFMARNQIKASAAGGGGMAMAGIVLGGIQLVLLLCGIIVAVVLFVLGPSVGSVFSSINSSLK